MVSEVCYLQVDTHREIVEAAEIVEQCNEDGFQRYVPHGGKGSRAVCREIS